MQRIVLSAIIVSCLCLSSSYAQLAAKPEAPKDGPANVPVKVVVLFSSGVGYFEHAGSITGNASSELRFKTQQINDILKSLVLQDLGGGKVGTVVYPSQDPITKTLKSFQVDITGDPSLPELLGQLRGAKIAVTTAQGESFTGTVLGVEKRQKPVGDKNVAEVWVVNLIAGGLIRSVELAEAKKLELEDKELQEELNKALLALAQARDQDKKPVTLNFTGQGERQVRIGYVVETPVWKTSYRLVLPGNAQDKPKLVGWAIVENQTDNDWNNIQLSLVSGRPISFIQDLYQPLYIPRPVVQPELYASLKPQTYEGGMTADKQARAENTEREALTEARQNRAAGLRRKSDELAKAMPPGAPLAGLAAAAPAEDATYKRMDNMAASVQSVASAAKVGELFQYTVGNVSLPRQRSAMIPIITDDLEVEKVSIYNVNVLPRNPLNGARIKNTTGKHLLQGPVTVIDGAAYAGDARIDNVPPTQERFLSYGVDLQLLVDAKNNKHEDQIIAGKIVKGVLWVTRKSVASQDYIAQNKADTDKALVVEHPLRGGWKLVEPAQFMEKTDQLYRFKTPVAAGKTTALHVVEEQVNVQQISILHQDTAAVELYAKTDRIPASVRDALGKAIALKHTMTDTQRQMDEKRRKIQEITQEQTRIRENLKTVDRTSDYAARLVKKLNDQESQIETLQNDIQELQKKFNQQRSDLETYLLNTTIE